jgi:hypothetical protein
MNIPTPEVYPPPATQEIFSKQKGLMDYINWKDIQRKTGITKDTAYTFIEKELIDNAIDYVETHHSELVDGYPSVQVKILPHLNDNGRNYLRLVVINSNDGTPLFNEDLIRSILDPKSKVSSKRNQFKVNRGALGDALKEVLGIPYALFHEYDDLQEEWNEPLIIRNNSTNEEFHVRLIIDRVNQDIGLDIQRKTNTTIHNRYAASPNTTEIEIRLPVFDENSSNKNVDVEVEENGGSGDWDDLTLENSMASMVLYPYSYSLFITHIDFTTEWRNPDTNEKFSNYSRRYQQIEKGWTNKTSVYFYTLSQFREFILELADDKQSIYDVLYKVFREGSNLPKTSLTQMKVGQLKNSPADMDDLYDLLRASMVAPSSLSLPFNVKNKSARAQALKGRVMSIHGGILDVKYKSDFGVVKSDNGKVQIPYFFEIAVMRLKRDDKNLIFEQAINSSAALGDSLVFAGKEFYFFPPGSKFKHPARSIYNIFEYYGYSHDKEKAKKKHSIILVNLISPKIDYQSYGKSRIDYMPFINKIEELTVKACQGGGGRAVDGKSSRISVVRKILEDRQEKWNSWDNATRQSHWWTMSDVFYAARKKLVEEEGYEVEEIDRKTLTGYINDICENELHVKREDIGIIAADRAQLYFNGQWMDVGFNEIRELSLYGTDLIIIEKEGMVIQLKEFADEYGIALLNPRGFLVDYATGLPMSIVRQNLNRYKI